MSEKINGLAQLLPGKTSLDECTLEELQHLVKRYPFFAPAQFLLLQKLKETDSPGYEAQYRKAVLYYPDPLQFEALFSAGKFHFGNEETENTIPTPFPLHQLDAVLPSEAALAEEQPLVGTPPETSDVGFSKHNEWQDKEERQLAETTVSGDGSLTLPQPDKTDNAAAVDSEEPTPLPAQPFQEHVLAPDQKSVSENELPVVKEEAPEPATPVVTAAPEMTVISGAETASDNSEKSNTALPTPPAEPLSFEPFHTVDYFASQGIRISAETLPKDKLSRQLRSFTEWLKVMKRLPAADIEQSTQSPAEKNVESLASHSVQGSDVLTEAMAEVWAKQGAREKAIETYNKLSLQNPSKRAYFAAKIENLSRS